MPGQLSENGIRAAILAFAVINLVIGVLAAAAPETFYEEVGTYGPRNDHYIGDIAAFYLAMAGALVFVAFNPAWRAPILWLAAVWYGLHALNHVFDIDEARSDARGAADTILLAVGAVLLAGLARMSDGAAAAPGRPRGTSRHRR